MAQKTVDVPGLGQITLAKRRGTRSLRLSITADGRIRVGLPTWAPYSSGINFALKRREWISKHLARHKLDLLNNGGRIGKSYRLSYSYNPDTARTTTRLSNNVIRVASNLSFGHPVVQAKARIAAERALRQEAGKLLPQRLELLAGENGFKYQKVIIKKLTSRWGSCSSRGDITLNFFLMQLPWELIDHVILHELVHTNHLNHSPQFWAEFERVLPGAKRLRRQLRDYRPVINTVGTDVA